MTLNLHPRFSFTISEKLINVLNSEGIGNVKTVLSENKVQQPGTKGKEISKLFLGIKGQMFATVLLRLNQKCFHSVDNMANLLECVTCPLGWQ